MATARRTPMTGRVGPGPDEQAVADWLRALAREAAPEPWGPRETPAPPSALGPVELSPEAEGVAGVLNPFAEAFYRDAMKAVKHPAVGIAPRHQELYALLSRNVSRYLSYSRMRLSYLYEVLRGRDRVTFSVIPFLLHVNLPTLPGYVTSTRADPAPHGIRGFDFNDTIRLAVGELFPEVSRRMPAFMKPVIRALMVMGSVGTIGHTGSSDIDYWVVVDEEEMAPGDLERLKQKIRGVELWANRRGLEVHFFIVDTARARRNDFGLATDDAESSGSAQALLLKEEFYRTALFLQGQLPFWWVVPLGIGEPEYIKLEARIRERPVAPMVSFVDLGGIGQLDRREFFGAALWQINKALKSPFKSLLKMALLARYMEEEHPELLCDTLKRRVFEGERSPQYTDPYVLLFDAITEHYAEQGDWRAFSLVQTCFYLKVGLKLSREVPEKSRFMQRFKVMRAYVLRWGWDKALLSDLDGIDKWSAERVDHLGLSIRAFMLGIYRHLIEKLEAEDHTPAIEREDVTLLGRRLFACFAGEAGKIHHLYTYFLKELIPEERITVVEVPDAAHICHWEVHRRLERDDLAGRGEPVRAGVDLAEIAAWLSFNGLFRRGTTVSLLTRHSRITNNDFHTMLTRFEGHFARPDPFSLHTRQLLEKRRVVASMLVINFDERSLKWAQEEQGDLIYIPANWDVLNYGRKRESLVRHVALITLNSWGEMFCVRYDGAHALTDALGGLFRRMSELPRATRPEILVPTGHKMQSVKSRLSRLMGTMEQMWIEPIEDRVERAFVYESAGRFQIFRRRRDKGWVIDVGSLDGVVRQLGRSGPERLEPVIDHLSVPLGDLRTLVEKRTRDREALIYLAWRRGEGGAVIYVYDEQHKLFMTRCSLRDLEATLSELIRKTTWHLKGQVADARGLWRAIRVYELRDGRVLDQPTQLRDDTGRAFQSMLKDQPEGARLWLKGDLRQGRSGISLKWGREVFSPKRLGPAFVYEVVRKILKDHTLYNPEPFIIRGSDVSLPWGEAGLVQHLRLMEIYQRRVHRELVAFQGARPGKRRT